MDRVTLQHLSSFKRMSPIVPINHMDTICLISCWEYPHVFRLRPTSRPLRAGSDSPNGWHLKKNATRFSPDSTNLKPVLNKMNKINNYLTTMNFHILTVTNRDSSTIYTPFPGPTAAQRRRACDFSHETQLLIVHLLRLHFWDKGEVNEWSMELQLFV